LAAGESNRIVKRQRVAKEANLLSKLPGRWIKPFIEALIEALKGKRGVECIFSKEAAIDSTNAWLSKKGAVLRIFAPACFCALEN
jgi:hypothetical protein